MVGTYSVTGTVRRHASLKARIPKFNMRCAGSVEVEELYLMLLLDLLLDEVVIMTGH